jgi:hypothetical protein
MKWNVITAANISLLTMSAIVQAQTPTHEHGVAELTLVLDQQVQVELLSPMANLVGFEGPANTDERRAALQALQNRLKQPLLAINGCQLTSFSAPLADMTADEHEHEHEHEHEDKHEHGDEDKHEHGDEHADLHASWTFQCENPQDLRLTTRLFEFFPGISTLKLQWITPSGQGASRWQQDDLLPLQ